MFWVISRWLLALSMCNTNIQRYYPKVVFVTNYVTLCWNNLMSVLHLKWWNILAKLMRLLNPFCSSLSFLIIFPDLAFRLHSKKWPCYQSKNQSIANAIHKQIKGKDFITSNLAFILGSARTAKRCQAKPIQLGPRAPRYFFFFFIRGLNFLWDLSDLA